MKVPNPLHKLNRRISAGTLAIGAALLITASGGSLVSAAGNSAVTASNGKAVKVIARGVSVPTAFAFHNGTVFVSAGGAAALGQKGAPGGVYVIQKGKAKLLAGSPPFVAGIAWHGKELFVSAGTKILAWGGWNGSKFTKSRVVVTAPKGFPGFNGITMSGSGRIFAGVSLANSNAADHSRGTAPFANDIVSVTSNGNGQLKVVASDLRQPWQGAFVPGRKAPIFSVLGQDNLGKTEPPDYLAPAGQGDDYGFPVCNWSKPANCAGYSRPFKLFPAHASPMGIGLVKSEMYVALFGGTGKGPEVIKMSSKGGAYSPFLTGFQAPVIAVGASNGRVYAGDASGAIYRVHS